MAPPLSLSLPVILTCVFPSADSYESCSTSYLQISASDRIPALLRLSEAHAKTALRELHPLKLSCPIDIILGGSITSDREEQPLNEYDPMLVTPKGILIFDRMEQALKAKLPIDVSESGRETVSRAKQFSNTPSSIEVMPSSRTTFSIWDLSDTAVSTISPVTLPEPSIVRVPVELSQVGVASADAVIPPTATAPSRSRRERRRDMLLFAFFIITSVKQVTSDK